MHGSTSVSAWVTPVQGPFQYYRSALLRLIRECFTGRYNNGHAAFRRRRSSVAQHDLVDHEMAPFSRGVIKDLKLGCLTGKVFHIPRDMSQRTAVLAGCGPHRLAIHQQLHRGCGLNTEGMVTAAELEVQEVPVNDEHR